MDIINKELLNFFQKGLFQETNPLEGDFKKRVEETLFLGGMKRFVNDLKVRLKLELKETYIVVPIKIEPLFDNDGIYMFSRSKDYRVFELNSDNTHLQTIESLNLNFDKIVKNSLAILNSEIEEFVHNKNLFNQEFKDLISEKREEGFFIKEYDFYNTTPSKMDFYNYTPVILATYYAEGTYMKANLLGMKERVFDKTNSAEKLLMKKKKYTKEETREVLEPVIQKLIERFNRELKGNVEYNAEKELEKVYGLNLNQLSRIRFTEVEKSTFTAGFDKVYVPVNITKSGLAEVAELAKVLDYLGQQPEYIQDVLRNLQFGDFLNLHSKFPQITTLNEAQNLVSSIEENLNKAKEFLQKGEIEDPTIELPDFGRAFFLKFNIPFEYNGSKFERIDYRLPGSKKTRSIMYENGKKISANRFFRILRKSKKQK